MAASELRCVYFNPGTLSRNIEEIEAVMQEFQGVSLHEDPHDPSTFLVTLPADLGEQEADHIAARLSRLKDKHNGHTLLEAWPSKVSLQNLKQGFTGKPRFIFE
jgi:hypothetical protein